MSAVENQPTRETRQTWRGRDCSAISHKQRGQEGVPLAARAGEQRLEGRRLQPRGGEEHLHTTPTPRDAEAGANQAPASPEGQKGPVQGGRLGDRKRTPSWLQHLSQGRKLGPEL